VLDAGALALSKDRSMDERGGRGYGAVRDLALADALDGAVVDRVNQEHGLVALSRIPADLRVGTRVRVLPNHACMTAAMHDRYHVVDGGSDVVAVWDRVNGW
jgi:D-serine deaminase-like pyridoxal phosphate-dependent protein